MALLWFDSFDHYGLDETKLTEGPYDQADAAFTLSEANPRTGARCLRRDSSASDDYTIKSFDSDMSTIICGFAYNPSILPSLDTAYPLFELRDSDDVSQIVCVGRSDGALSINIGSAAGQSIGITKTDIISTGEYNHIEFGCIADTEEITEVLIFSENFTSGNLDLYTFKADFSPTLSGGSKSDFSIVSDDFGDAIKVGSGPVDSHIGLYRAFNTDETSFAFTNVEFKFKVTTLNTGDNGILLFRDSNFNVVFGFGCARDSGADSNQAPNVAFIDQPGQPGNPIGTNSVDLNKWYTVSVTYNSSLGSFQCNIIETETDTNFASVTIPVQSLTEAKYLVFENDNVSADPAGECIFDDIIIKSSLLDSNGIFELRVNGVTELSGSDIRTTFSDNRSYRKIAFSFGSSSGAGVITDLDDVFILDSLGSWNNYFLGDKRALLRAPSADTNVSDFEPVTGDIGYLMVDEDSPDEDTTYVFADSGLVPGSPPFGSSEFGIHNLPNGISSIAGISVFARAKKMGSSDVEIFTSIISDTKSASGSPHDLAETYGYHFDVYEYDPFTIANFTPDGFNSVLLSMSAEFVPGPGSPAESPAEQDPFFANVVSLLHFNGSDTSTTFTDELGHVWTAIGDAQLDTAFPKFGTAAGLFDGSGDFIRTADSDDWSFGSGDFTIEFFVKFNTLPSVGAFHSIVDQWGSASSPTTQRSWLLGLFNNAGTYQWQFAWSTTGTNQINHLTTWISPSASTYYHVAVTRSGTSIRTFVSGNQIGSTTTTSNTLFNSTNPLLIGALANSNGAATQTSYHDGWVDELRITKGIARYTANFTPPASEFPDS